MRIFIAALVAETNSFSPIPTGDETFAAAMFHGNATQFPATTFSAPLHVWARNARADGDEVVESICTSGGAGGTVARQTYERLRDQPLNDLKSALPVDMVLLNLHGAMSAYGYDDCEGDILRRLRTITGSSTVIGAELDLHCTVTPAMLEAADALITYKENPHTDIPERAEELYSLCASTVRGEVQPVMYVYDCRMVSAWPTFAEPMASFVRRMQSLEGKDGILSISFAHCFAFNDVPHNGAQVLVIADREEEKAAKLAMQLGQEVWQLRALAARTWMALDSALDQCAAAATHPIVLVDFCDNAGGGAPSDSTYILRAILDRGIANVASGIYWDPLAVRLCKEAGEGATLTLRVGGKCCAKSGFPIDLPVTVRRFIADASQPFGETQERIGDAVWVQAANDVDLVLATIREQTYHPAVFTQFGIDLHRKRAIVVKSSIHFYAGFAPIAAQVMFVSTGGLLSLDYTNIPYTKFRKPYWPRVADPFAKMHELDEDVPGAPQSKH